MDEFGDIPRSRRKQLQEEWDKSRSAGRGEGHKAGEAWARHYGSLAAQNPAVFTNGEIPDEAMAEFEPSPEEMQKRGLIIDGFHMGYRQGFKAGAYTAYLDLKTMLGGDE